MTPPEIVSGGIRIEYSLGDEGAAEEMAGAIDAVLGLAQNDRGLGPPKDCRLYVMTSWRDFFFQPAPGLWKVLLTLGFPLWSGRARRTWPYSAGWAVRFGRRVAIGIKPPRLLDVSDKTVGTYIFEAETDPIAKIRHVMCHELVHAASTRLRLSTWLNEARRRFRSIASWASQPYERVPSTFCEDSSLSVRRLPIVPWRVTRVKPWPTVPSAATGSCASWRRPGRALPEAC